MYCVKIDRLLQRSNLFILQLSAEPTHFARSTPASICPMLFALNKEFAMIKTLACIATIALSTGAIADELRAHSTRDSGSYEVNLRDAGIPISGGLAWTASRQGEKATTEVLMAAHPGKPLPARHAATPAACPLGCRS